MYGEAILQKSNIYAKLLNDLFTADVDIHYISNITGHGLRKIMRARQDYTYVIEKIFEPQELFLFIQKTCQFIWLRNVSDIQYEYGLYSFFTKQGYKKSAEDN